MEEPTTPTPPTLPKVRRLTARPRALAGSRARATEDTPSTALLWSGAKVVSRPPDPDNTWRDMSLDDRTLSRLSTSDLIRLMCDLSPEISRAIWDLLRMANPGYEVKAYKPGTDEVDEVAQEAVDGFVAHLIKRYGSMNVPINRLLMASFIRGAFMTELVLDKRGRNPLDIATPDPDIATFRQAEDPDYGTVWELGQMSNRQWESLAEHQTVRYVPIDPLPGDPYGRPPVRPAFFVALFLLNMLHDLRRVIMQQGYPRIDISINMEKLREAMPDDLEDSDDEASAWLDATIDEIAAAYTALEPDDAYVHPDIITVNRPVGTVDTSSLGAVSGLIEALERMATRALKTVPLVMGTRQTSSETQSNREWELWAAGIKALQHPLEELLAYNFTLALQAQGIQASVVWRFAELRASEELRDAQTESMKIANAKAKYEAGWISQNEAAAEITGKPADSPTPRTIGNVAAPPISAIPEESERQRLDLLYQMADARREVAAALGLMTSASLNGKSNGVHASLNGHKSDEPDGRLHPWDVK